jgi:hypothetical protein
VQAVLTLIKCVDIGARGILFVPRTLAPRVTSIVNPETCTVVSIEDASPELIAEEVRRSINAASKA